MLLCLCLPHLSTVGRGKFGDIMLRGICFAILMVIYCAYLINRLCTCLLSLLLTVNCQLSTINCQLSTDQFYHKLAPHANLTLYAYFAFVFFHYRFYVVEPYPVTIYFSVFGVGATVFFKNRG